MLYSHKKQFLFIHIPKTAGKSVKEALSCHTSRPGLANFLARRLGRLFPSLNPLFLYRWRTFEPHLYYREVEQLIASSQLQRCFKFCFVRNPYKRMISYYNHIITHSSHTYHERVKKWGSFEAMTIHLEELKEPSQLEYIKNSFGIPSMDFIGRFEKIDQDFEHISSRLELNATLPWVNSSSNTAETDFFYSDIARHAVYQAYEEDFDYFEYPKSLEK